MNKIALVVLTLAAFALPCGTARAAEGSGTMRAASHDSMRAASGGVFDAAITRLDWHPRQGGLQLSAGAVIGDIRVAAMAHPPTHGVDALGDAWVQARIPAHRQLAAYLGIGYRATGTGFYAQAGMAVATDLDGEPRRARDQAIYPVLELGWSYRYQPGDKPGHDPGWRGVRPGPVAPIIPRWQPLVIADSRLSHNGGGAPERGAESTHRLAEEPA